MAKITMQEVKQALLDERFRVSLPESLAEDISKFLSNPGCACNHPIYKKVIKTAGKQLAEYYPQLEQLTDEEQESIVPENRNNWTVINCHIDELSGKLRQLPHGRKQLDVARWQDQVTVIINQLD